MAEEATVTGEQRKAFDTFVRAVSALRLRVTPDAEGWPMVQAKHGQLEWYCDGEDCHSCSLPGQFALAVYSMARIKRSEILAVPGVKAHQVGDRELRAAFPVESLPEVARVIGARRRRLPVAASPAQLEERARFAAARRALREARQASLGSLFGSGTVRLSMEPGARHVRQAAVPAPLEFCLEVTA